MRRIALITPPLALALTVLGVSSPSFAGEDTDTVCGTVVELFTSQGCSSCPPADRLLTKLGLQDSAKDNLILLSFHVDYWNYIGWKDPFATKAWTKRQRRYAAALPSGVYTPQAVVNGRTHAVGSRGGEVKSKIRAAQAKKPLQFDITARISGKAIEVDVKAEAPDAVPVEDLRLTVVLYENGHITRVTEGENDGEMLRNDFVVRALENTRPIVSKGVRPRSQARFRLNRKYRTKDLGIAAFWQHKKTLHIYGGGRTGISKS